MCKFEGMGGLCQNWLHFLLCQWLRGGSGYNLVVLHPERWRQGGRRVILTFSGNWYWSWLIWYFYWLILLLLLRDIDIAIIDLYWYWFCVILRFNLTSTRYCLHTLAPVKQLSRQWLPKQCFVHLTKSNSIFLVALKKFFGNLTKSHSNSSSSSLSLSSWDIFAVE